MICQEDGKAFISCVVATAQVFIKEKTRQAPPALLSIVTLLHNQMLSFDELGAVIASLCEDWYLQERSKLKFICYHQISPNRSL